MPPWFSYISLNWKGQPLVSYETVLNLLNLIGSTRTKTGLKVAARLDPTTYETGVKIPDEEMDRIRIRRHHVNPNWNYTISPRSMWTLHAPKVHFILWRPLSAASTFPASAAPGPSSASVRPSEAPPSLARPGR